ncbi:MAG TPA: HAD family hydrolase [Rhodocyclaceae bacterium]|nr:HAD family hydrolase [Rhodocyclaceae bacterium]
MHAGVLFDLDETLVDRRGSLTRYASKLWQRERRAIALSESEFIARFHAIDDRARTPRKAFFERVTASVLPTFSAAAFEEDFYSRTWESPVLFDDVVRVLGTLRQRGYRLGIVTNGGERAQSAKIRNSPLGELIDTWIISATFGVAKPDAAIYAEAIARLDLDVARSWFIGDSPVPDVVGPTRAGFKAIWIERPGELHMPWPDDEVPCYVARIGTIAAVLDLIPEQARDG